MPFSVKDWKDYPNSTTPLNAAALEDLETRLSTYSDTVSAGSVNQTLFVDVTQPPYNCPRNGTGNAAAVVQAAHDAEVVNAKARGGRGLVLFLPDGWYNWASEVTLEASTGFSASIIGAGGESSIISVPSGTDLGADHYAIKWSNLQAARRLTIANLRIERPSSLVFGTPPCNMSGVQLPSNGLAQNLIVNGFYAGIDMSADHSRVLNCYSGSCYYGLYFGKEIAAEADQMIGWCNFDGNALASIGIRGSNMMGGVTMISTHLGVSPWCILKEDPSSSSAPYTPNTIGISGCKLIDVAFENTTYGCIYSPNASVTNNEFIGCDSAGMQTGTPWGGSPYSTAYINDVGDFTDNYIIGNDTNPFMLSGTTGHTKVRGSSTRNLMQVSKFDTIDGRKLISDNKLGLRLRDHQGNEAVLALAGQAVTAGDLLMASTGNTDEGGSVKPHNGTFAAGLGVAISDASVSTTFLKQVRGSVLTRYETAGSPTANTFCKPSATEAGRVVQAANWADGPMVGKIRTGIQTGQKIYMDVGI